MSEQGIFDLYRSLKLWTNPTCTLCRSSAEPAFYGPIGIWQVGTSYFGEPNRVVFVGKNARGSVRGDVGTELAQQGFIDATSEADRYITETWGPYWTYTRSIIEKVFGDIENGWERIAFTNLVKCNNSMKVDSTTKNTKSYCLDQLSVTWKELSILKPHKIVMYTGRDYDDSIEGYIKTFKGNDITGRDCRVPNGNKMILWWDRQCVDRDGREFRILRTSHPQMQMKKPFVEQIARWITSGE